MTRPGPSEAVLAQSYAEQEKLEARIAELEAALEELIQHLVRYGWAKGPIARTVLQDAMLDRYTAIVAATEPADDG